ncbi:hypothetical protein ABBQ38_001917 [Trebouxia sp. C0009 RCD-2024]
MLSPELQQQWHVDSNRHLGAIKVKPKSRIQAVWQCNKCPAGQPHVWSALVNSRTRGSRCPYCSNRRVCVHNSLATIAPEVATYWDRNKNEKTPEQVLAGSNSRAEWKCPGCNHEWKAQIAQRVMTRAGCPKCSSKNKSNRQSQPTFVEAQPASLAEWDYERNEEEGFYPHEVTLGSNKLVHWICSRCPRGQPHRWTASPAAELDVDKSGFAPSEVTAQSHKKVWWRNAKRGSWKQVVQDRIPKLFTRQGGV